MFCPHKNSYLQLVCAMNPRVINKAVDHAMERAHFDPHTELPPAQRLESMQPSLYAPHVDITRAQLGFGRIGLRLLNRALHSTDNLEQLQALHSVLDQVQISENAMFLIDLQLVYRLIDLMLDRDPIIKEKVCLILTSLATYYQGRKRIMSRPVIIENLMRLIMRDRKEIRYAASYTLKTLARDRCACEVIMQNEQIIENLLKMVKSDHTGIVLLHLATLINLVEWDPVRALKANAFQVMLSLFENRDPRIVSKAMDCMSQLCKHDVGKILADDYDLTFVLRRFIKSPHIEVVISAVGLMEYTTLTTRSKWRAKEACNELTSRLVHLCCTHNKPLLQMRCMQVLINLCDSPDIRNHMKFYWEKKVKTIKIRTHEEWDGTSETSSYGLETAHNYRTMCIEKVETIKNDYGDNAEVVNVHSYLRTVLEIKERLLRAINWKPYKN
ncbi:uncharacterized protein LOC131853474 [Achroia grisella]|uniref:uncharacterized protein LOC131853474 n=1 Tax=Achroia grisella TaxID=688607 RepID=UPI0027D33239|nr:uncharacterized protein LOC131853474 [Achroia grisella]